MSLCEMSEIKLTVLAAGTTEQDAVTPHPHSASWLDRFADWVQRLPGPAWLFYLSVGIALSLTRTLIGWADGSYPVGTFFRIHVLDGLTCVYLYFVLHYLDDRSNAALAAFRSVLTVDDTGYQKLRYQLTTMPARPVLAWSAVGLTFGFVYQSFLLTESERQLSKYFTSPAATVIDLCIAALSMLINTIFAYHTIRQLRLVSSIYTKHTRVSIFDTGPLYALSRVTGITTVALLIFIYVYLAFYGNWQVNNPADAAIGLAFVFVALVTFVWPLLGAHTLLQEEKERRKGEIARRVEAITDDLHRRADAGDYSDMASINDALDALTKEQGMVSKASTWPWDPEVLRAVVTALLLPVVIWLITRVLERLGV